MYDLFIGNHENVLGRTVYHKRGNSFIPCVAMQYAFPHGLASGTYTLISKDRKQTFKTQKIYLLTNV